MKVEETEDPSLDIQIRLAEIQVEFNEVVNTISADNLADFDGTRREAFATEKTDLETKLEQYRSPHQKKEVINSFLDDIYLILEGIKNRPMEWDETKIRQLLDCVIVESKEQIRAVLKGRLEIVQFLNH